MFRLTFCMLLLGAAFSLPMPESDLANAEIEDTDFEETVEKFARQHAATVSPVESLHIRVAPQDPLVRAHELKPQEASVNIRPDGSFSIITKHAGLNKKLDAPHIRVAPQDPPAYARFQHKFLKKVTKNHPNAQDPVHIRIAPQDPTIQAPQPTQRPTPTNRPALDEKRRNLKLEALEELEKQAKSAHYSFDSALEDTIYDNMNKRTETRNGLDVTGMYSYSDGYFHRTVEYVADENGYRVVKQTETPIGDGPVYNPDGKADVSSSLIGGYSITLDDIGSKHRKKNDSRDIEYDE